MSVASARRVESSLEMSSARGRQEMSPQQEIIVKRGRAEETKVVRDLISEEQRKKNLEAYSLNLLKSIEKRASTQGQGGIDSRFRHLATSPVLTSLSSRVRCSVSSAGSCAPQLGSRSHYFVSSIYSGKNNNDSTHL